ncbi:Puromycin N-acetyltransferase [Vanrija pseudolonga]|uniref:Puromycin N-acetyltransferase n=1 Tax=Vanrija pseudolonga TaxID=143232 RepID=A0AAF1BNT8_9TREE|nr:Puromycin N-acetyltransferase [Vanrija pseudolonga]
MSLTIRTLDPARVTDAERDALTDVLARSFGTYTPHVLLYGADADLDDLVMRICVDHALKRHVVVVAERGGAVVGVAMWLFENLQPAYIKEAFGDATKQWWLLAQLGVSPSEKGTGVGSALLKAKREETDTPLYLNTQTPANVAFYEKNGYDVRADKAFDVPWSEEKWHDHFMSNPGDA